MEVVINGKKYIPQSEVDAIREEAFTQGRHRYQISSYGNFGDIEFYHKTYQDYLSTLSVSSSGKEDVAGNPISRDTWLDTDIKKVFVAPSSLSQHPQCKPTNDIRDNKIRLLEEDIWCVHKYLDDINIPREDDKGLDYSIVGRIKQLELYYMKKLSEIESEYLSKTQPTNDNAFVWTDEMVEMYQGYRFWYNHSNNVDHLEEEIIKSFKQSKQSKQPSPTTQKEFKAPASLSEHPMCKKEETPPQSTEPKIVTDNSDVAHEEDVLWFNPQTSKASKSLPEITSFNDVDGCYLISTKPITQKLKNQ